MSQSISGYVIDKNTRLPLEGAIVGIIGKVETKFFEVKRDGYYSFDLLPGTYDIGCNKTGYESYLNNLSLTNDDHQKIFDIELSKNQESSLPFNITESQDNNTLSNPATLQSRKRVSVANLVNHAQYSGAGDKLADQFVSILHKFDEYEVIDRLSLLGFMNESYSLESPYLNDYSFIKLGKTANIDVLFLINVYEFSITPTTRVDKGNYYIGRYIEKEAVIQASLKAINIANSSLIFSENIHGRALSSGYLEFDQIDNITISKYSYQEIKSDWKKSSDTDKTILLLGTLLESGEMNAEEKKFKNRPVSDFQLMQKAERDILSKMTSIIEDHLR